MQLQNLYEILLFCSLPGMFAGIVLFIYAYSKQFYKNNQYIKKFIIEIFGASITSSFLAMHFDNYVYKILVAFCIGLAWSKVIQLIRGKITRIVEAILGNIGNS